MKTINETFTDKEFALLVQAKNGNSWHDFILRLVREDRFKKMKGGVKNGNNNNN